MLEVKVERCSGIDVGKKLIDVCVLIGAGPSETGRGGSAIRNQRWELRSIAGMAEGERLYRVGTMNARLAGATGGAREGRPKQSTIFPIASGE